MPTRGWPVRRDRDSMHAMGMERGPRAARWLPVAALLSLLGAGLASGDAAQAADTEPRIGFVNAGRVTSEAPQADAARQNLEEEFGARDEELSEEQDRIRDLESRLNRRRDTLDDGEQRDLQRELAARQRELRRAEEEFREDFNMRRNEELGRLQRRIVDTISHLAESQGFDLIVSEGVIYASDRVDVTDQVLDRLRREHEQNQ